MKIVVNQMAALGQKTGVGHYAFQLYRHLRARFGEQVEPYPSKRWQRWEQRLYESYQWMCRLKKRWSRVPSLYLPGGVFQKLVQSVRRWYAHAQLHMHRQIFFGDRYQLYHEPNFIPFASSLPTVTTWHDLSALLYPQWHPAERVKWVQDNLPLTLAQSSHFITGSEFIRRQLIKYLHIPADRVTCVNYGARPEMKPLPGPEVEHILRTLGYPSRYLLYVGTIEPRKNVLRLMQAYCSLPFSVRAAWPLLLVGGRGWRMEREQDYYQSVARHAGVQHVGYVADKYLPALYNGARALLYPSYYEGFGLPPVEMLACGGAVITSTAEALVEVVGQQAHLVHPEDTDGWRQALLRVVTDEDWWQHLRAGAVHKASAFTWQRCAEETHAVYRKVLQAQEARASVPICARTLTKAA